MVKSNFWLGNSPFAVGALSCSVWRCTVLAPGFLKARPVHPAPGQANGAVQSPSSLLPAVWLLRCALLCFFPFRPVLATFEPYFSPLDWLSDLIPNTFPEPFTFSTNSELYAHWACHDWGYMTKMPSLLSMDLGSKWGITNPTKEFPFLHTRSRQGWNCPSGSPGGLFPSMNWSSSLFSPPGEDTQSKAEFEFLIRP